MISNNTQRLPYENYRKPSWFKRNWIPIATLTVGLIAINIIFLSESFQGNMVDPNKASQLGEFTGGYIGTFLALISIVILYLTFRDQRESSTIEKFENKYFELIKLHRENVSEIGIGDDFGRKIFVVMIREFREILKISKEISERLNLNYSKEQIFVASYCGLFFGVGPNSSRML